MIDFEYNGISSRTYGVISKSTSRPILPALRRKELTIPGKHGTYSFGSDVYDNRIVSVDIAYVGDTLNEFRLHARDIAVWLSQTSYKELIFDDEPDKYYLAKIYNDIGLETLYTLGEATIQFECQPFALYIISSAEDIYLDDTVPLDSDILLNPGDDYTIHL